MQQSNTNEQPEEACASQQSEMAGLSNLSTSMLSSSCPAELSRLPKELTFLREPRPHHFLGDPKGEEGRDVAGREPLEPQVVLNDRPSVSSDSRPEAARWRMEL